MTDERMGDRLWHALARLHGRDAGVMLRHYSLDERDRVALARRIAEAAHRGGITFAIARDAALATKLGADLVHNPTTLPAPLPFSRSVHDFEQARRARDEGAALVFVSPVHPTRSHPGQEGLGEEMALRIAETVGVPAIALGGMSERKFAEMRPGGFHGWAGIDAWLGD